MYVFVPMAMIECKFCHRLVDKDERSACLHLLQTCPAVIEEARRIALDLLCMDIKDTHDKQLAASLAATGVRSKKKQSTAVYGRLLSHLPPPLIEEVCNGLKIARPLPASLAQSAKPAYTA